jgi:hypothetical protein
MDGVRVSTVRTWAQFDRKVRYSGQKLLGELDHFNDAILVAGCQRSGTTALSRLITESDGMVKFQVGSDDELDAALILAGRASWQPSGRYCFQTTYLNNSYSEYFEHSNYKLIWVLRNPASVIYSMLYNWKRAALNRLFRHCGSSLLDESEKWRYQHLGAFTISPLRRACLSYNVKVSQLFKLRERLGNDRLLIMDYDKVISGKDIILPKVYEFIDLPYRKEYAARIHSGSVNKAKKFYSRHRELLDNLCQPIYVQACTFASF